MAFLWELFPVMKQCNYIKCNKSNRKMKSQKNNNDICKKLKLCSKCKSAFYCTRNHQKKDWKYSHKYVCC